MAQKRTKQRTTAADVVTAAPVPGPIKTSWHERLRQNDPDAHRLLVEVVRLCESGDAEALRKFPHRTTLWRNWAEAFLAERGVQIKLFTFDSFCRQVAAEEGAGG